MRFAAVAAVALLAGACTLPSGDRVSGGRRPPATDREIDCLIIKMRHEENPCHIDYTSSVYDLIAVGKPAVPKLVAVLLNDAEDEVTRLRARTALNGIVITQFGFEFGRGWGAVGREEEAKRQLTALGQLDPGASAEERGAAAQRWREWAGTPADDQPVKHAEPSAATDPTRKVGPGN